MAYATDDTYNVLEEHILRAFMRDGKLGGLFTAAEEDAWVRIAAGTLLVYSTAALGATSMTWDHSAGSLDGAVFAGQTFTVAGDATAYTVSARAYVASNRVTVTFSPALAAQATADAVVTLSALALPLKLLEQEHRDDAAEYNTNELPALSVEILGRSQDVVGLDDRVEDVYQGLLMLYVDVVRSSQQRELIKQHAARVERCLAQQHYPGKQLVDLPAALENGNPGSVIVSLSGTALDGGPVPNSHVSRGVAAIAFTVAVETDIEED